jgi:hypothetical protein
MEITSSRVFPVTDGQVEAFSTWAINTYGTYNGYLGAFKAPAIDTYIRTHILPIEMKSVLRETEPYIGVICSDIHISRLQIYRKRILDKIKYMKGKLGKLAFPIEAAQIIIDKREAIIRRRLAREAIEIQQRRYFAEYAEAVRLGLQFSPEMGPEIAPTTIVTKPLTKEEAETCLMDDNCVICMDKHKMIDACITNCGHQFGRACLNKWTKIADHNHNYHVGYHAGTKCPLCRTIITEMTKYVVTDELSLLEQVLLA